VVGVAVAGGRWTVARFRHALHTAAAGSHLKHQLPVARHSKMWESAGPQGGGHVEPDEGIAVRQQFSQFLLEALLSPSMTPLDVLPPLQEGKKQ
jgi:hypothetical protein